VDADAISRSLTEKGSPLLAELAAAFGGEILTPDGALNRKKTADIVFTDPDKKSQLETIITDRVLAIVTERVEAYRTKPSGMAFLDVPLLFETDAWKLCDEIWFVTADQETRIERVMARENCAREDVLARIASQMPEEEKRSRSDVVIDNSKGLEELLEQLDELLTR
jgi:dephospho-CoA kinase